MKIKNLSILIIIVIITMIYLSLYNTSEPGYILKFIIGAFISYIVHLLIKSYIINKEAYRIFNNNMSPSYLKGYPIGFYSKKIDDVKNKLEQLQKDLILLRGIKSFEIDEYLLKISNSEEILYLIDLWQEKTVEQNFYDTWDGKPIVDLILHRKKLKENKILYNEILFYSFCDYEVSFKEISHKESFEKYLKQYKIDWILCSLWK